MHACTFVVFVTCSVFMLITAQVILFTVIHRIFFNIAIYVPYLNHVTVHVIFCPDWHFGDDHHPLSSGFHKKCKTLFNRTIRNCMLHPWLLYLSAHIKPILFSEVSIMSNEYMDVYLPSHVHNYMHNCMYICKCLYLQRIFWQNSTITIITTVCIAPLFTSCLLVYSYFIFISVFVLSILLLLLFSLSPQRSCCVMLCMPFFYRHSPLIDCKIVILEPN